jgi:hypothetical protein
MVTGLTSLVSTDFVNLMPFTGYYRILFRQNEEEHPACSVGWWLMAGAGLF